MDKLQRRLVRTAWLLRYWLLWKYKRVALVSLLLLLPTMVGFGIARMLYAPEPADGTPVQAIAWLYYVAVVVIAAVLSFALAPRPQAPETQQAERPQVEDGIGMLRVYGEVWIEAPVILGWQQIGVDPITRGGKK